MKKQRRKLSASFKVQVVLEALQERQTLSELAQKHMVHPAQINSWKKEFLEKADSVFEAPDRSREKSLEEDRDALFRQLGEKEYQLNWLKKKLKE
jgi:transposase-like protein